MMRTTTIIRKSSDFDWAKIPIIPIDNHLETPFADISAMAQVCYDEDALYVRLVAKEADIRAEYTGALDMPCQDSCLEFFFCPMEGDNRYFNIEFNPNCCMYLGLGSCLQDLVRLFPAWENVLCPQAARTSDGWEITYQVPVSFVRRFFPEFTMKSGNKMRANFYKCGDLTVQYHEMCWNMITDEEHDFHRPCDFGILIFE